MDKVEAEVSIHPMPQSLMRNDLELIPSTSHTHNVSPKDWS